MNLPPDFAITAGHTPGAIQIYVAGPSAEMAACVMAMNDCQAAGMIVTSTWATNIAQVGAANPTGMAPTARQWTATIRRQIVASDVLWLRLGDVPFTTIGAYVEYGIALQAHVPVVVSGPPCDASIFFAQGATAADHAEALAFLIATQRALIAPAAIPST